jgi:hypothetical protein
MEICIMAVTLSGLSGGKTRRVVTLTSGTSWTVPAGVTYVNATLIGGGGGGANYTGSGYVSVPPLSGQKITTNVATTPGASISYSIGAGGSHGGFDSNGGAGGTTTFTGATSAVGGSGGIRFGNTGAATGIVGNSGGNYGQPGAGGGTPGVGGAGLIELEYWV